MKIAQIYNFLNEIAPFDLQEKWDNSGLLLGNLDDEIEKIYISLDLDSNLIKNAEPNSLFITHHPLIFKGLKSLDPLKYPSNLIYEMIKKNISLISLHTNYDKTILNKFVASEVLKYEIIDEKDFLIFMQVNMNFDEFAKDVKTKLEIKNLRVVKSCEFVKNIALCTGSGFELLDEIDKKIDCFLSGDLKYHLALSAYENKISLIDINHFDSEKYFAKSLALILQKNGFEVIITNSINPFTYC